jgi:hypothetical protein
MHLLLVKGIHEVVHLLTPLFNEHLDMQRKADGTYTTSTKIGSMEVGSKSIGDAGYDIEESLSGGRMFHVCDGPNFSIEQLVLEKNISKTSRPKWKRFVILDSFLDRPKETLASYTPNADEVVDVDSKTSSLKRKRTRLYRPDYTTTTKIHRRIYKPPDTCSLYPFRKEVGI